MMSKETGAMTNDTDPTTVAAATAVREQLMLVLACVGGTKPPRPHVGVGRKCT